jgi:hypothetical protein
VKRYSVPLLLIGLIAVSAVVAAAVGRPVWAASLGAALVLAYWALELLAARLADHASIAGTVALALGGMFARFAIVLGVMVLIGFVDRPAFVDVALGFLAVYTVYMVVRLVAHPLRTVKAGRT